MAGRQIVALKMRVRFSSITPASSKRARSRVSLFTEREKPPRIQHCGQSKSTQGRISLTGKAAVC